MLYESIDESFLHGAKCHEWQLCSGGQWQKIENDHVIECHYCHPGAKGITINTKSSGKVFINFDTLRTDNPSVRVQRLSFLPEGQMEDFRWFFRGDSLWSEYGGKGDGGTISSISSKDIEQQFNADETGSFKFTVGAVDYQLDFASMTQTNLVTNMKRKVRRRPKFTDQSGSLVGAVSLATPPPVPPLPPSWLVTPPTATVSFKWEFLDDEGDWIEYQSDVCSYGSADIEREYQSDPHGQLKFSARGQSYTLDFTGMFQINNVYKTKREVKRTQNNGGSATSTAPRWQFKDMDGKWKNFTKGKNGCSVSSQDVELKFQQNQAGSLEFSTGQFTYELNFADMRQKNLSTKTSREVRRVNQ